MQINIEDIQAMVSNHNYLDFDKLLTQMYEEQKLNMPIYVLKNSETIQILNSLEDIEYWLKKVVQIYGIFGFI